MADDFKVVDTGNPVVSDSGMKRNSDAGKTDYSLVFDGPLVERLAVHLTKGAGIYGARNWMKAAGEKEAERFRTSAVRHFVQWLRGDRDEDHFAAVVFNLNGAEYLRGRQATPESEVLALMAEGVERAEAQAVVDIAREVEARGVREIELPEDVSGIGWTNHQGHQAPPALPPASEARVGSVYRIAQHDSLGPNVIVRVERGPVAGKPRYAGYVDLEYGNFVDGRSPEWDFVTDLSGCIKDDLYLVVQ